jgi:aldoxime dehydratase
MAYWRDPTRFAAWHARPEVAAWIDDRSDPFVGRWMEVGRVSPRALDTLIADAETNWGLARLADDIAITYDHAYWGGTRDRIQIAASQDISNPEGPDLPQPTAAPEGIGEIVDVVMPPNVVIARGGPDWSRCHGSEREEFLNSVYPAYVRGGRYLRDGAADSGCYAASLVQEVDADGNTLERNHLIAYFVQLDDLERWTKSHPTHVEIYARFMRMFKNIARMPDMNLYHEVSVIPEGQLTATYNNCLPGTGLLRFGRVRTAADRDGRALEVTP